jgi:hypothetical protein
LSISNIFDNFNDCENNDRILSKSSTKGENIGCPGKQRNSKTGHGKRDMVALPNSVRSLDNQNVLWIGFKKYLESERQSASSIRDKLSYGRRYYNVLVSANASELHSLTGDKKSHAMKALASLAKFLGRYDRWLDLVRRYRLKWSSPDKSIKAFKSLFDSESEGKNLDSMLRWIRDVSVALPAEYRKILLFNTLTGLRPDEAQKAIYLVKTNEKDYIDRDRMILKHYLFPNTFLRQTKNAYISIINQDILEMAKDTPNKEHYYPSLRKRVEATKGIRMNMYYCRKVFATYLRNNGIEPEIIDLLQGRISSSVFVSHYYRPDINELIVSKIRPAISSLSKIIETV